MLLAMPTLPPAHIQDADSVAWPFADAPDTRTFTTAAVLDLGHPVLLVSHDDDGDWQFLCGTTNEPAQARVIHLRQVLEIDAGLAVLAGLPRGWIAWREGPSDPWQREAMPTDLE